MIAAPDPMDDPRYRRQVTTGQAGQNPPVPVGGPPPPLPPPPGASGGGPGQAAGPAPRSAQSFGPFHQIGPAGGNFGISNINPALAGVGGDMSDLLKSQLTSMITGGQSRFSPEVMAALTARAKAASEGQASASTQALRDQLASTGNLRSGQFARGVTDIRQTADTNFSRAVSDAFLQKTNADYEDKANAINRAQGWLDNMRAYSASLDQNQAQRESTRAQIALGYANLNQQREQLERTLAAQREAAEMAQQAAGAAAGSARSQFDAEMQFRRDQFEEQKRQNNIQLPDGTSIPASLLGQIFGGL